MTFLTLVPVNDSDGRQKVCSSFSRKLFGHPNSSGRAGASAGHLGVSLVLDVLPTCVDSLQYIRCAIPLLPESWSLSLSPSQRY